MGARHLQAHHYVAPGKRRSAGRELHAGEVIGRDGRLRIAGQREQLGPVPHHDRIARVGEEGGEGLAQRGQRRERRVVVVLDVRQDRDLGLQGEHRAVGLVGLDHEPLARPPARVGLSRPNRPADQPARVECQVRAVGQDHRPLDQVLQLAHVARPRVLFDECSELGVEAAHALA